MGSQNLETANPESTKTDNRRPRSIGGNEPLLTHLPIAGPERLLMARSNREGWLRKRIRGLP